MDRRERLSDMQAGLLAFSEGLQAGMWTAMPGIIQSFNPAKRTAVVQPAIQAKRTHPDFTEEWVTLPLLLDCPVVFPGGGDVVISFPLKKGDECLVVFASRCIDAWWQQGGVQVQAELRMHDLSDGFCIPGPSSVPRAEAGISTNLATMRSRDGQALISLDPAGHEIHTTVPGADVDVSPNRVHITTPGADANITTNSIALTVGAATFQLSPTGFTAGVGGAAGLSMDSGTIHLTGQVFIEGRRFITHNHPDLQGGNTGGVN